MHLGTTLTQFIIEEQRQIPGATGEFTGLLNDVATACKMISNGERPIPLLRSHHMPIVPAISGIVETYPVKPTIHRPAHVESVEAQGDQNHHPPLPDHPHKAADTA